MTNRLSELFKLYASSPATLKRHSSKALDLLRAGELGQLKEALSFWTIDSVNRDIQGRIAPNFEPLFKSLKRNSQKNAARIIEILGKDCVDLHQLDGETEVEFALRMQEHLIGKFQLIDDDLYKRIYKGVAPGMSAAQHYMTIGRYEGNLPNFFVNPGQYLDANRDVLELGIDPLVHFAIFGWRENRPGDLLFDSDYYLQANPDVAESGIPPFIHFMTKGQSEGRSPTHNGANDISSAISSDGNDSSNRAKMKKRGTILIVSHDAELGGAQQVVRVFSQWIQSATAYDVKLVIMRGGAFVHEFEAIAPTFNMQANKRAEVAANLRNFAGDDVKAVFINSIASGGILEHWDVSVAPAIAFIHELPKVLEMYRANVDLISKKATTVVCGSEAVRTALRDQFNIEHSKLEKVYGFIEDASRESSVNFDEKATAKKTVELDPDKALITACGVAHWRKSPELFVEVAEKTLKLKPGSAQFVWIGGGPDQEKCEQMVRELGLTDDIIFTGYEPDIMRWLKASDVFLLPSQEDPFPLVCLYAARALNPIICFEDAGGMPEFVASGAGKAVAFGSVNAMTEALSRYLDDDNLRYEHGRRGREQVEVDYTVRTTGPQLMHHIRTAAQLQPALSVIVPNYNYEKYLPARLDSIFNQTFQDFELILLDDMSKDNSIEVMQSYAERRPGTKFLINKKNSGSPFKQWMKGMEEAQSDVIWIAEADDTAESDLLETMLPSFDNRNVFLGYVKSVPTNADGEIAGDYEEMYLNRIQHGRWSNSYLVTDHEEANLGLGIANCIPNASSVIFRRFVPEQNFVDSVTSMKLCGDWLFYLRAMRGGLVAYSNQPLNYHRRHVKTVTHSMEGSPKYFDEFALVRNYVADHYRLNAAAVEKITDFTNGDLDRFSITDAGKRKKILDIATRDANKKKKPTVLYVVSDLSPGGGQLFSITIANNWMKHEGRAVLLNAMQFPDHSEVLPTIDSRVSLYAADHTDAPLPNLIKRYDIDVVHTSLWWSEALIDNQIDLAPQVPWVTSMHGCHETHLVNPAIDGTFPRRIARMIKRVDQWVHTADKNMRVFEKYGYPNQHMRLPNGMEIKQDEPYTRHELGLREDSIVLCLATRAIKEKGWTEAANAVMQLNREGFKVDLMLIGEGPMADTLRKNPISNVHLYGHVSDLQRYLKTADIGLLPSYFVGESMPLVLLEMMGLGKPVIATNVGEIASIIGKGKSAAGICIDLEKGAVSSDAIADAIKQMFEKTKRGKYAKAAKKRFDDEYTVEKMITNYEDIYRQIIAQRAVQDTV